MDGQRLWAWIFCQEHADKLVSGLVDIVPQLKAVAEKFPGHAPCQQCAIEK
jgi:hypothetical protein